jgi:flavin reductase (DIM6/NTAB) family NADH-FMN oxidoreductase RutF
MARKTFTETDWEVREGRFWVNFFNTLSGFRSSVLIGSTDGKDHHNVGIFNSLVHLGANPPLLGFILRPTTVKRDTYNNILATKYYTINHISKQMIDAAHQTSASYDATTSEFDATGLTSELDHSEKAPFVVESPVSFLMEFKEEHSIINGTRLIVGAIREVRLNESMIEEDGSLKMADQDLIVTSGLYHYHGVNLIKKKTYARP